MRLWIGNMAPGTTDDEVRALLKKYAPDLECVGIERVEGTGTHPAVIAEFTGGTTMMLSNLALRLNGMYWKGRSLNCNTMMR
jgi:RNA recognition motif-containing protein